MTTSDIASGTATVSKKAKLNAPTRIRESQMGLTVAAGGPAAISGVPGSAGHDAQALT
ncbi:hypothetical protein GCM10009681_45710 [Luedemannella helvata]|uniref:Uncharacterized protein n=1 Tax=Luedemannella helvata TaxID=349315 RepID=A0ABN2KY38_9ACTN